MGQRPARCECRSKTRSRRRVPQPVGGGNSECSQLFRNGIDPAFLHPAEHHQCNAQRDHFADGQRHPDDAHVPSPGHHPAQQPHRRQNKEHLTAQRDHQRFDAAFQCLKHALKGNAQPGKHKAQRDDAHTPSGNAV